MTHFNNDLNCLSNEISRQTQMLRKEATKDRLFQLEMAIAQESDPLKKLELERLYQHYLGVYQREQNRRFWLMLTSFASLVLISVFGYIYWDSHLNTRNDNNALSNGIKTEISKTTMDDETNEDSNRDDYQLNDSSNSSVILDEFIGTWTGTNGTNTVSMTFYEDGTVYVDRGFDNKTVEVVSMIRLSHNTYLWSCLNSQDESYLVPTAQGMGGVGVQYAYGVRYDGSSIRPLIWQTSLGQAFDYSQPGDSLTQSLYRQ